MPVTSGSPALEVVTHVETGCAISEGPPDALPEPIKNYMMWWHRMQLLIWGGVHDPPMPLPFELSYADAAGIVDLAIDQAITETGGIPGAVLFMRDWLEVGDEAQLAVPWDAYLAEARPALEVLLLTPYERDRVGAFSEPVFLKKFPGISQRGNRLHAALFDQSIPAEPPDRPVTVEPPPDATRRERMELVLEEAPCVGCHQVMDPPGFALELFDEVGQLRALDQGKPVDTSGVFRLLYVDGSIPFENVGDLGYQLADTCVANLGFADRFLRYALSASDVGVALEGEHALDRARMRQAFMNGGRSYRSLVKEFAQGPTLRSL